MPFCERVCSARKTEVLPPSPAKLRRRRQFRWKTINDGIYLRKLGLQPNQYVLRMAAARNRQRFDPVSFALRSSS